jgi:hypothetical protein
MAASSKADSDELSSLLGQFWTSAVAHRGKRWRQLVEAL